VSKYIHLFAAIDDLVPVLREVEAKHPVKYVRMRSNPTGGVEEFASAVDLPDLGRASAPSAVGCDSYLVTGRDLAVHPRRIVSNDGTVWFAIDQVLNPDTVEISPGGIWEDDVVLSGRVATLPGSEYADTLVRAYRNAVRKHFVRIRAFWVGPRARSLLDAGKRLTMAVQSPREYDLAPESVGGGATTARRPRKRG
jgi:hypothetical protein